MSPFGGVAGAAACPPPGKSSLRRRNAPITRNSADSTLTTMDHMIRNGFASTKPAISRTTAASTKPALIRITEGSFE
ncbi:hypothetical protein B0I32_112160 [Nonomuraea fuscirosea]|uniref:Uncharacterized protein n=1 Tax=Nonomuraea fuscirosea TaxID=1291556 RepID=A0A2T0MV14_9ACTN|nr:hypothetical protein B0I32_112160 [Nonomuraea fuscirosea]